MSSTAAQAGGADRDLRLSDYRPGPRLRVPAHEIATPRVPCVDAHNHLGRWLSPDDVWMCPDAGALVALMDEVGVEAIVNLDGRWGTELTENLERYDLAYPGRFATFCHVDWQSLRAGAHMDSLVRSLHASAAAGARGLKVWKDLGLGFEDGAGRLLSPSDPRLDVLWAAAGQLGLPILIHTADPIAFFDPVDRFNERYEELLAHPDWSFCDERFPGFWQLLDALEAIVSRHPGTVFIAAHVGCCAEDLAWVRRMLTSHANFNVDIAGRLAELGRQPRAARQLLVDHPDRVLFGTDAFPPSAADYRLHFRFLESGDEYFPYHPDPDGVPPQGRWNISGLDLPEPVLAPVYRANARRLLGV